MPESSAISSWLLRHCPFPIALLDKKTHIFGRKILRSHPYPSARSCGFNYFENDSDFIQLMSFLHLRVPLSTHELFLLRLILLYLKLFLVLTVAKDNLNCRLLLCLRSVTHTFRYHSFLQLS